MSLFLFEVTCHPNNQKDSSHSVIYHLCGQTEYATTRKKVEIQAVKGWTMWGSHLAMTLAADLVDQLKGWAFMYNLARFPGKPQASFQISDKSCYRFVDWKSCTTACKQSFCSCVVVKNGGEVEGNSTIGMKRLEVSIAACECNIAGGFCDASQHTQVPHAGWRLAIDVDTAYTPAAHSHNLVFLTVFAN